MQPVQPLHGSAGAGAASRLWRRREAGGAGDRPADRRQPALLRLQAARVEVPVRQPDLRPVKGCSATDSSTGSDQIVKMPTLLHERQGSSLAQVLVSLSLP